VHCTYFTPDNHFLLVNDLGTDYVSQYAFDASNGKLNKEPVHQYKVHPGEGPRHIAFTPDDKYAYLVTEMGGSVVVYKYDDEQLHDIQTISAVPKTFKGQTTGSEVHVSPDGKFLYVSLRKDLNKIAVFSIDQQTGNLIPVEWQSTKGVQPRYFTIDPTGKYLLVSNMYSDNIVVFKRDQSTGRIEPTGTEINVSMPVCLKMIAVKQ
jgi:6-phosphogluconolactonase